MNLNTMLKVGTYAARLISDGVQPNLALASALSYARLPPLEWLPVPALPTPITSYFRNGVLKRVSTKIGDPES